MDLFYIPLAGWGITKHLPWCRWCSWVIQKFISLFPPSNFHRLGQQAFSAPSSLRFPLAFCPQKVPCPTFMLNAQWKPGTFLLLLPHRRHRHGTKWKVPCFACSVYGVQNGYSACLPDGQCCGRMASAWECHCCMSVLPFYRWKAWKAPHWVKGRGTFLHM